MSVRRQCRRSLGIQFIGLLTLALASGIHADVFQGVSHRNASVPLSAGGNGDSVVPIISSDGRFVLFSSAANNLVAGDNSQLGDDVFLRDRPNSITTLVSANFGGAGGGNGNSFATQISTNGRYVVFQSDASDLVPNDTNAAGDIFVRNLQAGSNILVSVAADGSKANGASTDPAMTPDGRYVAFLSAANNLVAGDTNGTQDVFVRDLISGVTSLISVGATGTNVTISRPAITPDGRYVAFASTAKGLVSGVSASSQGEVYVRDLVSNVTIWASTNAANSVSNLLHVSYAPSIHPAVSDNGRFVSFKTGTAAAMVFQYDASSQTTATISTNGLIAPTQNDDNTGPEMSPNGRFIVFVETNQSAGCLAVRLWDSQAGSNLTANVRGDGSLPANSLSDRPSVSPDGRYVAFMCNAANLTGNTVASGYHIFRRDVQAGTTQLVDADTNGVGSANLVTTIPTMSADGRFIAFESLDGSLVAGDSNKAFDVFVRDLNAGATELISQRAAGLAIQAGDGLSSLAPNALSDDGRTMVFTSYADDLVTNDFNGTSDVFAGDLIAGTNALVSVGADGNSASGSSFSPALASSGRFVAFLSTATNLAGNVNSVYAQVYRRDLLAGTNVLVSVASDGVTPGNGDTTTSAISQDGNYVVFNSRASNLATGGSSTAVNSYLRNFTTGTTALLTNNTLSGGIPSISADGRYVAFVSSASQLVVRDTQAGTNVYSAYSANAGVLSPTGARLLLLTNNALTLSVISMTNKANLFVLAAKTAFRYSTPWSRDGRFLTFVTGTNAMAIDANGINDVYLRDLQSNTLTLVSINSSHSGAANAASDSPVISGDGRFVAYRSYATDLVAAITNPPPNILVFDRLTGSNRLLTAAAPGSAWSQAHGKPLINGDGHMVAFPSLNPAVANGDLNRVQDVFAGTLPIWGTQDSDGDGVPDLWMMYYFGHPTGQAGDLSRAQDDADGDGMSNLEEFLAGTDPTLSASVLRVQIKAQVSASRSITLNWPAVLGKNYQVQFKTNLADPVWVELAGATVVGNSGTFTVPMGQINGFYRVTSY